MIPQIEDDDDDESKCFSCGIDWFKMKNNNKIKVSTGVKRLKRKHLMVI